MTATIAGIQPGEVNPIPTRARNTTTGLVSGEEQQIVEIVDGHVTVDNFPDGIVGLTNTELRAAPIEVTMGLTDTELRLSPVAVSVPGVASASLQTVEIDALAAIFARQSDGSQTVTGPLTDTQLRDSPVTISAASLPLPTGAATEATLANRIAEATFTARIPTLGQHPMSGSVAVVVANDQSDLPVADDYAGGEILDDQTGAGAVLTFTFASPVQLLIIFARMSDTSDELRVDPFGGTPSATRGIPIGDQTITYLPTPTTVVKAFTPAGARVTVGGARR